MAALRKKLKAGRGFSLAETLVAVLILALLSSAAALGVSQALWQRNKSIALADAQTVASTAGQIVADQLRYGRIAYADSDGIVLASGAYQAPIRMGLDNGCLTIRNPATGDKIFDPLVAEAYCNLCLSELNFTVNKDGERVKTVDVRLSVARPGESESLWSLEFSVSPVNSKPFAVT